MSLSASEFGSDMNAGLDEDEDEARRSKPEEVTVNLVTTFLQHALQLCLVQQEENTEVRMRVERRMTSTYIGHNFRVSAEDDGGICRMARDGDAWEIGHAYLAFIEAKRAFKHVSYDEKTNSCRPIVSNDNLAQYLGEAVIAWKANRHILPRE